MRENESEWGLRTERYTSLCVGEDVLAALAALTTYLVLIGL